MEEVRYEAELQAMLVALGAGGTRELAERALTYALASQGRAFSLFATQLGGLAEVAELLDRSRPAVSNWMGKGSKLVTPAPVLTLKATPVWNLEDWRVFGRAHPELTGPGFDPFAG